MAQLVEECNLILFGTQFEELSIEMTQTANHKSLEIKMLPYRIEK